MNLNSVVNTVLISFVLALLPTQVSALSADPQISPDYSQGYDRELFKHWIDADKNGCTTRAEVLIAEAIVKPKVGKKCALTGGKWVSAYDAKTITDASKLDVDHLVPLAEAWRSGAWAWTAKQRQDFANDLSDSRALIAVTLNSNRSKSDKDISDWLPAEDKCGYVKNWVAIKMRYSLTFDEGESLVMRNYFQTCNIGEIKVAVLSGYKYQRSAVAPTPEVKPTIEPVPAPSNEPKPLPTLCSSTVTTNCVAPTPSATPVPVVKNFYMPGLYEDYGTTKAKWTSLGFANPPKVIQAESRYPEYGCKQMSDSDLIISQSPVRNAQVNSGTIVTLTLFCYIDFDSGKVGSTPTPTSTPAPTSTPIETPTSAPTSNGPKQCYVNGYTRKNGTYVKGYYRSC